MLLSLLTVNLVLATGYPMNFRNNACHNFLSYSEADVSEDCYFNPDVGANPFEIAHNRNYSITNHTVINDGYILTIFEIPPKAPFTGCVVFLQHGIISNSDQFMLFGNKSLGCKVWLGNFRGTRHTQKHMNLHIYEQKFWKFNCDNLASDLREMLKYVSKATGNLGNIVVFGHSLGSNLILQYASMYPEESRGIIKGIISLGGTVFFSQCEYPCYKLMAFHAMTAFQEANCIEGLLYQGDLIHALFEKVCRAVPTLCRDLSYFIVGESTEFAAEDLLAYVNYLPNGLSVRVLRQGLQQLTKNTFQKFDFGREGNILNYGTPDPPRYPLDKVTIPTVIFYATNDAFTGETEANRLYAELGSEIKNVQRVPRNESSPGFNHLDLTSGTHVGEMFYTDLLLPALQKILQL